MKNIAVILTFIMSVSVGMAQQSYDAFHVQVDGLGCPFCAYGLEKKFKEFKGIKNVAIDIETGDFSFDYPAEKTLSLADVENQVVKAGYTPMSGKVVRANGETETMGTDTKVIETANLSSAEIPVLGNCGMCQARIEKAANSVPGVAKASWDKDTKLLQVEFDASVSNTDVIEKAIAKVGHDTKNHKAAKDTYDGLPGCCQYERSVQ